MKRDRKLLLQNNLINPLAVDLSIGTCEYLNIPFDTVGLIPFTYDTIEPIKPLEDYVFVYGSNRLVDICSDKKISGVHYDLDQLNYQAFVNNRSDMLNDDMIMPLCDVLSFLEKQVDQSELWFIRPSGDTKVFSGEVSECKAIVEWLRDRVLFNGLGDYLLDPNMICVLSKACRIDSESRWFIIDGEVISGSLYRQHDRLFKKNLDDDLMMVSVAKRLIDNWLPHDCCVMDLAEIDGNFKVIEFNCINCSGFYDHDVVKIFRKLYND